MNKPALPYWLGVDHGCVLVYDAQEQAGVGAGRVRVWNSHSERHEIHPAAQLRARIVPFFQYMSSFEPGLSTTELIQAARVICNLYTKLHAGTWYNDECEACERDAIDQENGQLHALPDHGALADWLCVYEDESYDLIATPRHAA